MSREHFERLMGDVEEFEGADHPFLKVFKTELGKLDSEWEIKRDGPRDENKEPLINQGEWMQLMSHTIDALRSWKHRQEQARGQKWK